MKFNKKRKIKKEKDYSFLDKYTLVLLVDVLDEYFFSPGDYKVTFKNNHIKEIRIKLDNLQKVVYDIEEEGRYATTDLAQTKNISGIYFKIGKKDNIFSAKYYFSIDYLLGIYGNVLQKSNKLENGWLIYSFYNDKRIRFREKKFSVKSFKLNSSTRISIPKKYREELDYKITKSDYLKVRWI